MYLLKLGSFYFTGPIVGAGTALSSRQKHAKRFTDSEVSAVRGLFGDLSLLAPTVFASANTRFVKLKQRDRFMESEWFDRDYRDMDERR